MALKGVKVNGTTYPFDYNYLDNKPVIDSALSDSSENAVQNKAVKAALDSLGAALGGDKAPVIIGTASGSVASFTDGADGMPVKSLVAQINPVQDLHGYDAPWPAGGGYNKLPKAKLADVNTPGLTVTIDDDGTITLNGTTTGVGTILVPLENPLPAAQYTFSFFNPVVNANGNVNLSLRGDAGTAAGGWYTASAVNRTNTFTSSATAYYWQIEIPNGGTWSNWKCSPMIVEGSTAPTTYFPYSNICPISGWTGANVSRTGKNLFGGQYNEFFPIHFNVDVTVCASADKRNDQYTPQIAFYDKNETMIDYWGMSESYSLITGRIARSFTLPKESYYVRFITYSAENLQIEFGATNSSYEPYSGTTIPVSWQDEAGTVYGGTLDVTSGVLTVTMAEVDLGTLTWVYENSRFHTLDLSADIFKPGDNNLAKVACSAYRYVAYVDSADNTVCVGTPSGRLYITDSRYTDAIVFKTSISGIQLVYELATPIEYSLTTGELIDTLLGVNNVCADVGEITTIEYPADTKLYIDAQIAAVMAAMSEE